MLSLNAVAVQLSRMCRYNIRYDETLRIMSSLYNRVKYRQQPTVADYSVITKLLTKPTILSRLPIFFILYTIH